MKDQVMSKKSFANEKTAARKGKEATSNRYIGTHRLPSGRFCYVFFARTETV